MLEVNLTEQNIAPIVQLSRWRFGSSLFCFQIVMGSLKDGAEWLIGYFGEHFFFQLYLHEMWHTQISTDQYFEWYIWGLFPGVVLSLSFAATHSVKFHYTKVKTIQTKNTYLHLLSLRYSNSSGILHLLTLWLIWYVFRPSNISISLSCKWISTCALLPWISSNLSLSPCNEMSRAAAGVVVFIVLHRWNTLYRLNAILKAMDFVLPNCIAKAFLDCLTLPLDFFLCVQRWDIF